MSEMIQRTPRVVKLHTVANVPCPPINENTAPFRANSQENDRGFAFRSNYSPGLPPLPSAFPSCAQQRPIDGTGNRQFIRLFMMSASSPKPRVPEPRARQIRARYQHAAAITFLVGRMSPSMSLLITSRPINTPGPLQVPAQGYPGVTRRPGFGDAFAKTPSSLKIVCDPSGGSGLL